MIETTLIELAISVLLFSLLVAYLITKIPQRYLFKLALIPATFLLALYMGVTIPQLLGYAYPGKPTGVFTYIAHHIDGNTVTLLAEQNGKMRLFKFAGDPTTDAELANAHRSTEAGDTVTGEFKGNGLNGFPGIYGSGGQLMINAPHILGMLPPKNEPGDKP